MKKSLPQQSEPARVDAATPAPELATLLASLRELIQRAREQALRAVDQVQVHTCWRVGYHIVEFEQGGAVRAAYGKRLLAELAERLTAEFGKGFDASNLRYMRLFYKTFQNRDALRHELSWTHYRALLDVERKEPLLAERAKEEGQGSQP